MQGGGSTTNINGTTSWGEQEVNGRWEVKAGYNQPGQTRGRSEGECNTMTVYEGEVRVRGGRAPLERQRFVCHRLQGALLSPHSSLFFA